MSSELEDVQYFCYSCKELLLIDVLRLPGLLITPFMRHLISLSWEVGKLVSVKFALILS